MLLLQGQALNSGEVAKALAIQVGLKSILLRLLCTLNNTVVSALAQRQIGFKTPWEALVLFPAVF